MDYSFELNIEEWSVVRHTHIIQIFNVIFIHRPRWSCVCIIPEKFGSVRLPTCQWNRDRERLEGIQHWQSTAGVSEPQELLLCQGGPACLAYMYNYAECMWTWNTSFLLLSLQDFVVMSLAQLLRDTLCELDLTSCVNVTDLSVCSIATYLHRLTVLRLGWCKQITDWGLLGIVETTKCDPEQEMVGSTDIAFLKP